MYKVKINLLVPNLEQIEYVNQKEGGVLSTEFLYFKKITIRDLILDERKNIFHIKDIIALKLDEYRNKNKTNYSVEELNKIQETLKELEKREKKELDKMTPEKQLEYKKEKEILTIINLSKEYSSIGIDSNEIYDLLKPMIKKFIFLDEKGINSFNEDCEEQFNFNIIDIYFFLLALSI